jgi:tetratricopeptide (TPR) repeat protein
MTEESTIQCDNCGTVFSVLEEVCPYCGQPQPAWLDEELPPQDSYDDEVDDLLPEEYLPPGSDDIPFDDEYAEFPEDVPLDEEYLPATEDEYMADDQLPPDSEPFVDDDIFAVEEAEWPEEYDEAYDEHDQLGEPYDEYDEHDASEEYYYGPYDEPDDYDELDIEDEEEEEPRRFTKRRFVLGCLGIFLCAGLFYGGIGLLGAYHGLQERYQLTRAEAETHYQRGQDHLTNDSLELAIAEFELALSLNPNFLAAREALRDAQRASLAQPTPTSETRSAAAESVLTEAEELITQENWAEAGDILSNVRELDPDYRADDVSELIYTVNFQLGLQMLTPDQLESAVQAFELALSERPDDAKVSTELDKALLYLEGKDAEQSDKQTAVDAFSQLYRKDEAYLDVEQRLLMAYEELGDELFEQQEWCQAEAQYVEASLIRPGETLNTKIELSTDRCQQQSQASVQSAGPTPGPQARATVPSGGIGTRQAIPETITSTTTATATGEAIARGNGTIYFSAFNSFESQWEILAVLASGGTPKVVVTNGTMPALSPNGRLLVYRSEAQASEGFHAFDLTTGEDKRITIVRQHVLPRWGGDNNQFIFVAQQPGSDRWRVHQGFADGKSDPIILRDGRTPDLSLDNQLVAYQGADPAGNNPGIYVVPMGGGEATRLTMHESDRSPDFSPDSSQVVFMSTRDGDWDIYTTSTAGSAPRQITTAPTQEGLPTWSPDGSQIAYVSDAGGNWNIYVVSAAGGTPTKVTAWDGLNREDWLMAQIWWGR